MVTKSVFEAAHKGDFEFVREKLEESPKILHETDSVSIKKIQNLVTNSPIFPLE